MKRQSIVFKMMIPMIAAMLIQAGLLSGIILFGGTETELENNAFSIMNERVEGRKTYLHSSMLQRWSRMSGIVETINSIVDEAVQANGETHGSLTVNSVFTEQVLEDVSDELIYLLRHNEVTGAFLIFEGSGSGTAHKRAGLYLRDTDPTSSEQNNSDLLLERAPAQLGRRLRIPTDVGWNPSFSFDDSSENAEFYTRPYRAALENPDTDYRLLGYWAKPFHLDSSMPNVITYSVPLMADGRPYGVIGVELSRDYLCTQLPYDELFSGQRGAYFMGVTEDGGGHFEAAAVTGPLYRGLYGTENQMALGSNPVHGVFYPLERPGGEKVYGCVKYLNLYSQNTPFENEQWAVIGITREHTLTSFSTWVRNSILISLALSLAIGLFAVWMASQRFSRPVVVLVKSLKAVNPNGIVRLKKTGIMEIDEMAAAIENLSDKVAESASKISKILEMAGIPIGVFEAEKDGTVFCSNRFVRLFHFENICPDGEMPFAEFRRALDALSPCIETEEPENQKAVYLFSYPQKCWISLKVVADAERYLGVAADITAEMLEKRRIEYERDYDLLTGLLNRRAFRRRMEKLLLNPGTIQTGALVMMDLDNLKYVNDTYGHDFGDEYIRRAASALKWVAQSGGVASRLSGDEFCVFFYGYENQEDARKDVLEMKNRLSASSLSVSGNGMVRVRASGGVSWYPQDSMELDPLIRFADYAMYKMKNNSKGEFTEFDRASYEKESYLLQGSEALNLFIEKKLLEFYFQPIVDVRTGEPFGYEALMRSRISALKSPLEILTLARAQSRLNQIEKLTWFGSLEAFSRGAFSPECRLFVNSIPSRLLSGEDISELERLYPQILCRVVLEFTEEEKLDENFTQRKRAVVRRWKGQIALDDYGTGYNGEAILLELSPDYIKIDISLVSDIDKNTDKQKLVRNLISYAREHGIFIIAEGVETKGEMETLIDLGADYLQGYYLGRPAPGPARIPEEVREEIRQAVCGRRHSII